MNLIEYVNRCVGGFSGGNKRKLFIVIVLVGNLFIIFLVSFNVLLKLFFEVYSLLLSRRVN